MPDVRRPMSGVQLSERLTVKKAGVQIFHDSYCVLLPLNLLLLCHVLARVWEDVRQVCDSSFNCQVFISIDVQRRLRDFS